MQSVNSNTEPSICIPRTLNNINRKVVSETFEFILGKGTVERVDIVVDKNSTEDKPFCRIFVHFRYWPQNVTAQEIRQQLMNGETVKVVYDEPWFWKCSKSRVPKPESQIRKPPYIERQEGFGDVMPKFEPNNSIQEADGLPKVPMTIEPGTWEEKASDC
jgi:hypothetical protein